MSGVGEASREAIKREPIESNAGNVGGEERRGLEQPHTLTRGHSSLGFGSERMQQCASMCKKAAISAAGRAHPIRRGAAEAGGRGAMMAARQQLVVRTLRATLRAWYALFSD